MFAWVKKRQKASQLFSGTSEALQLEHVRDEEPLLLASGIPSSADACAYEAVQKLLAVSARVHGGG